MKQHSHRCSQRGTATYSHLRSFFYTHLIYLSSSVFCLRISLYHPFDIHASSPYGPASHWVAFFYFCFTGLEQDGMLRFLLPQLLLPSYPHTSTLSSRNDTSTNENLPIVVQSNIGCSSFALVRLSLPPLSLSLTHTHAHTHANTSSDKVLAFNTTSKKKI
jgi:hypothetical protein